MSSRKPYNNRAGYIASRRSGIDRGWIVIYAAVDAGIDVGTCRYAIVCETHGTIVGATSMQSARQIMKAVDFCEQCMKGSSHA